LAKSGLNKIRAHQRELKASDIEDSIKSIPPGEWCWLRHSTIPQPLLAFLNPLVDEKFVSAYVLDLSGLKVEEITSPETLIKNKLSEAVARRKRFVSYEQNARLFYGVADGLPGLIADKFGDKIIVQINTAGIDRYRDFIKNCLEELTSAKVFFLDNQKYREREFLPVFENEAVPDITITENDLRYHLRSEVMQKIGFYYDHRENRYQLIQMMERLNHKFVHALDLFSYAGAWGLSALKGGAQKCTFVDQGDFETEVNTALKMNGFLDNGSFVRSDVFKFLDDQISKKILFDLILCDPPAFAKSHLQKDQALEGYSKLHKKVMKIAAPGAMVVFSSCTHYVGHEEFQKNIVDASYREGRMLQLVYTGMQGWDHPVSSLMDRSNYIKSYFYILEN
jgi:23S rRNA (cytosine1962-C5)-methyltransferase